MKKKILKFFKLAKAAIIRVSRHKIDDDDWDQRPEFICKRCGYHKKSCICK